VSHCRSRRRTRHGLPGTRTLAAGRHQRSRHERDTAGVLRPRVSQGYRRPHGDGACQERGGVQTSCRSEIAKSLHSAAPSSNHARPAERVAKQPAQLITFRHKLDSTIAASLVGHNRQLHTESVDRSVTANSPSVCFDWDGSQTKEKRPWLSQRQVAANVCGCVWICVGGSYQRTTRQCPEHSTSACSENNGPTARTRRPMGAIKILPSVLRICFIYSMKLRCIPWHSKMAGCTHTHPTQHTHRFPTAAQRSTPSAQMV
jgi:hypothetical protein